MKIIISIIIVSLLTSCEAIQTKNSSEKETKKEMQKAEPILISLNEEKTFFGVLKIKFISFSHEHSASSPNEPFSATTGVYVFNVSDGKNEKEMTIYTNAEGRSNAEKIFEKYELTLLKASSDQKTLTVNILDLN